MEKEDIAHHIGQLIREHGEEFLSEDNPVVITKIVFLNGGIMLELAGKVKFWIKIDKEEG